MGLIDEISGALSFGFDAAIKIITAVGVIGVLILFLLWNAVPKTPENTTKVIGEIATASVMNELPWWSDPTTISIVVAITIILAIIYFYQRNR